MDLDPQHVVWGFIVNNPKTPLGGKERNCTCFFGHGGQAKVMQDAVVKTLVPDQLVGES